MSDFKPPYLLRNKHIQTIYPALFSSTMPDFTKEIFELSDGDFLELMWYKRDLLKSKTPIVILFHGLAGSAKSHYIKRVVKSLSIGGFVTVVMQFRGCGDELNRLPRSYHSGDTADAKEFITHLKKLYPNSPLFAVGYSLGANMLLKLMGEWGEDALIERAVALSAPLDLKIVQERIDSGFSKLYQYNLLRILKDQLKSKYKYHDMESLIGLRRDEVDRLRNFYEFDELYTAPVHGFESADDYYQKCSSNYFLDSIKRETLIIQALDDPFLGEGYLPKESAISPKVKIKLTQRGGHVGFVKGSIFRPNFWLDEKIVNFLTYLT